LGGSLGASCASFVLIVLSAAGINLVVEGDEWPYRPGPDDARHNELLTALAAHGADQAELDRVRSELPCPRVAPEEVAGAAMFPDLPDLPADQPFAERAATWIIDLMDLNGRHGI